MTGGDEVSANAGEATRAPLAGLMVCSLGLLMCAQMAGVGPQGTALDDQRRESMPTSESDGWTVQYRFVGLLQPDIYREQVVDSDGQEVGLSPEEVILVRIVSVSMGQPPVCKNGMFGYKSSFASRELQLWPLGPMGPWRGLEFEFTGLCRKDPLTGKTMCRVDARPLWSSLALPCGVLSVGFAVAVTALSILVKRVVRRLRRHGT